MRTVTAALIIVAGATFAGTASAEFRFGGANSGAWCLFDDPWTYNCGFATLQQCLTTASGAGGQCQPNPSGPPPQPPRLRRVPRRPS